MDMGSKTYCKALKPELLPNTPGPWQFNQFELWVSLLSSLSAIQPLVQEMWVLSGSCAGSLVHPTWQGKSWSCKMHIDNYKQNRRSSLVTQENSAFCDYSNKKGFNCQISVISEKSKIDIYSMISTLLGVICLQNLSFYHRWKTAQPFSFQKKWKRKQLMCQLRKDCYCMTLTRKRERANPFRKHFSSAKFYSYISKMNNSLLLLYQE